MHLAQKNSFYNFWEKFFPGVHNVRTNRPRVKCGRADLWIFWDLKMTKPHYKPITDPNFNPNANPNTKQRVGLKSDGTLSRPRICKLL